MILSDRDIAWYIEKGLLRIEPLSRDTIRENGVDLRLGDEFCRFRRDAPELDTRRPLDVENYYHCTRVSSEGFRIEPYEHVLATTHEEVCLPDDLVGLVNVRSTFARLGLYIPPCFHPNTIVIDSDGAARPASEATAIYDPITNTWSTRKVIREYNGEMVAVYVDGVPEVVTPNHRYLVFDETRSPPFDEKPAMLLKSGDYIAVSRVSMHHFSNVDSMLYPHSDARVTIDGDLANEIRSRAKEVGATISSLSRGIGRSRSYILNLLNGQYGVRFAELEKVLVILGIPLDEAIHHIYITAKNGRMPATNFTHKVTDVADLVGYYVGDGAALSQYKQPVMTDGNEERVHVYGSRFSNIFGVDYDVVRDGNRHRLVIKSHVLRDWLAEHFGEGVLPLQPERKVPLKIMRASNAAVAKFIAGLFDAEGSSNRTEDVVVSTVSKILAHQVKAMLQRLGVYASIDVKPCKKCRHGIVYAVRVNGLSARKALRAWIERYTTKELAVPPSKEVVDLVPLSLRARKALARLAGAPTYRRKIQNYVRRGRVPVTNVPLLVRELREQKPVGWEQAISDIMDAARFRWVKVKRVEKVPYNGPVVDWETKSHWHVATSLVSHNTVVDAGFCGQVTIEIIGSAYPVRVYPGQRFLHVVFVKTTSPVANPYRGKYQGQRGVTPPRLEANR